jgi:hypothetical protein
MAKTVADVRLSAGLLDRAVARNRRRTARNRLIGATSTVVVVAAAYILAHASAAQVNSRTMISVARL